ncbi:hypothetical protein EVAR_67364_1 [Eumeta japonica]|uniref:Uncharacterized protein n=1 Tax=Eumeta variegata TaxID=151549 RepID=A0A4C1ZVJ7_EUMVA|nr:hypothetical protein EVAR_67364_1 [Eumeta japonica]
MEGKRVMDGSGQPGTLTFAERYTTPEAVHVYILPSGDRSSRGKDAPSKLTRYRSNKWDPAPSTSLWRALK